MVGLPFQSLCSLVKLPLSPARRGEQKLQCPPDNGPVDKGLALKSVVPNESNGKLSKPKDQAKPYRHFSEPRDQPQSAFLSALPAEVRLVIYQNVLCVPAPVVHIVRRKDGTLCHVRCRAADGECGTYRCYNDYSELSRTTQSGPESVERESASTGNLLPLLSTCRKTYAEAVDILYSGNTFSFFDLPVIDDFSCSVPSHRLDAIQRIQLEYKVYTTVRHYFPSLAPALGGGTLTWGKVRQILSGMKGLREIRVKVAKVPEAHGTPGMMPEVIKMTDFVADRTDGATEAMRRLLEVENVKVVVEEVH